MTETLLPHLAAPSGAAIFVRRSFGRAALLFMAGIFSGCSGLQDLPATSARPVDMFDAVVFAQEYGMHPNLHVARWTGPIRIALHGSKAAHFRTAIRANAARLSELTKLPIALSNPGAPSNLTISFGTLEEFAKGAGPKIPLKKHRLGILFNSGCLFFYHKDSSHRITSASIFIRTDHKDAFIRSCILEEMTQILGLPNDSDLIRPSIFNNSDELTKLTPLDAALVRALYHPSLSPGMARDEALRLLPPILN